MVKELMRDALPKRWIYTALGNVCEIIMGQSPDGDSYNASRNGIPLLNDPTEFGETYPSPIQWTDCPTRIAKPGDILFCVRGATTGRKNIADQKYCIGRGLAAIRGKENQTATKYLLFILEFITKDLLSKTVGSTFPNLSRDNLREVEIPLPPLEEQRRIADIATKADRLRRTRRYAQQLSDSYLQSVFLEMFGGAISQTWESVKVENLSKSGKNSIRTGPFGSQLLHEEFYPEGDVAVLGIDNVVQNSFVWEKKRFIKYEKYQDLKRYTVYPGDVLITIMGTCGRCAVVPDNIPLAINTKHLCCITLDQARCLPRYLQYFFLFHPNALNQLGISERGAVMPGLNMGLIKELIMPLPPLPLQQKFAAVVQRFERLRAQQREADRQAEHLFQSILHRAFRGEL